MSYGDLDIETPSTAQGGVATDLISSRHFQRVKLAIGAEGSAVDVSAANGLPVLDFETEVMLGLVPGFEIFTKFGRNPDVDAAEDIVAVGGDYAGLDATAAETLDIVGGAADTAAGTGTRTLSVSGLDDDWEEISEVVTMAGAGGVTTVNQYKRVNRLQSITAGSGEINAGDIIASQSSSAIEMARILAGVGITEQAVYTVPAGKTGYIMRTLVSMNDTNANRGRYAFRFRNNDISNPSWTQQRSNSIATDKDSEIRYYGGIRLTEKTDVIGRVLEVANTNARVSMEFAMLLQTNS